MLWHDTIMMLWSARDADGDVNIGVFLELETIRVLASDIDGLLQDGDYATLLIT